MEQYLLRVADRKPKLLTQETMNINVCKKLMENETKSAFMLSFCMLLTFRQYSFTFCFLKRQFQQWKRFQHCFRSLIQIKHRYDTMKRVRRVSYDWWSFLSVWFPAKKRRNSEQAIYSDCENHLCYGDYLYFRSGSPRQFAGSSHRLSNTTSWVSASHSFSQSIRITTSRSVTESRQTNSKYRTATSRIWSLHSHLRRFLNHR